MAATHKPQPVKETETRYNRTTANPILAHIGPLERHQVDTWRKPLLKSELTRPLYGFVKCITLRQ